MIYILARALGGDVLKNVVFGLGDTNCGKSVLTAAIMQSCGDYVGSFNAENLVYNRSSNDEAQKMRWALLLAKKRIMFSNEISMVSLVPMSSGEFSDEFSDEFG